MKATENYSGFAIELEPHAHKGIGRRFVCDERTSWDGSWITTHEDKAKTWKTARGAAKWLSERSSIVAKVTPAQVSNGRVVDVTSAW